MSGKAEYRSAIRSRKLIKQAFVELMQEKDIDKMTIKDIVTKADINRGTFYAHYTGIHDVREQIGNEILSALLKFVDEFQHSRLMINPLPLLLTIASFLEKDVEFYRLLINAQSSVTFLNKLKTLLMDKILSDEKTLSTIKNKDQLQIIVNLFTSGTVGLYQDWFNHKIKMSLKDLTLIINQIITNGIQPFLPRKK